MIYYNNISNGTPNSSVTYAYDVSGENWHGPRTAIEQLPSTSEWKNISLKNTTRAILNEKKGNQTTGGSLPDSFSYAGKAARLLTTQEINKACNIVMGSWKVGELDTCNYLIEKTKFSNISIENWGYWLENPIATNAERAWNVNGQFRLVDDYRYGNNHTVSNSGGRGVRPAIEVSKSNIEY